MSLVAKNMRPEDLGIGRLFERIQDAVIVADARTQQIVLWNSAAERVFGYSTSEALELRVEALVPEYLKARHRAGIARYAKTAHGPYIDSQDLLELPALTKDGEEIHIELSLSPIGLVEESDGDGGDDGRFVLAIVREVTERKRAEEALLQSEERYRAVVEQALAGIFLVDVDTKRILEANSEYQRLLGYDFEEIIGLTLYDVVAHDRKSIDLYIQLILEAKKHVIGERQHRRKDGSLVDVVASASKISYGDREAISIIVHDITERKQAEKMLWESEDRYRRLVELSPETIAVQSEGKFVYVNAAGARLLGATKAEELIGKPVLDFIHPDYVEIVKARVRRTQEEDKPTELAEIKMVRLDAETIDVETRGIPILYRGLQATQVVIRDITERKRVEKALREVEELFRSAFDNAPIGICVSSLEGHYLRVNRALCEILGYSEEDLRATTFQALTHPEDYDISMDYVNRVLSGEIHKYHLEKRYLHADGHPVWVSLNVSLVRDSDDRPLYYVAQVKDITERKQVEEELQEANRRLSEVATLRSDFTAMLAHEIGSPLATIRGFLEMLATGELEPAEEADTLAKIRTETDRLSTLVADVRSAAAIEYEEFTLVPRQTSTSELLEDATLFAQTLPGNHPLIVEVSAEEQVWADLYRIGQVLRNLLSNAAKYSPEGAPIELRALCGESPGRVRIEVADQGCGVHPDDVERIFKKYGRGRDRSGRKAYGVGLGLYLSQRILQAHGSELDLDSAPGGGSVFGFELEAMG